MRGENGAGVACCDLMMDARLGSVDLYVANATMTSIAMNNCE